MFTAKTVACLSEYVVSVSIISISNNYMLGLGGLGRVGNNLMVFMLRIGSLHVTCNTLLMLRFVSVHVTVNTLLMLRFVSFHVTVNTTLDATLGKVFSNLRRSNGVGSGGGGW